MVGIFEPKNRFYCAKTLKVETFDIFAKTLNGENFDIFDDWSPWSIDYYIIIIIILNPIFMTLRPPTMQSRSN